MFYKFYFINRNISGSIRTMVLLLMLFLCIKSVKGQENKLHKNSYTFESQLFSQTGITTTRSEDKQYFYNIKRTLLIYQQRLTQNLNFCLAGDTYVKGDKEPWQLTPYLKRAYLQYHNSDISLNAGLIVMEQFKLQRKIWGLRYIDKTFQNKFKYGENRNTGIQFKHKVNNRFSYDVALTSGIYTPEKLNYDHATIMSGQTYQINNFSIRLFNSMSLEKEYEHVISLFLCKELKGTNIALEIARKLSHQSGEKQPDYGFSVFATQKLAKNITVFGRYDHNNEKGFATNWLWGGVEYTLKDFLKTSIFYKNQDFTIDYYGVGIFMYLRFA